MREFSVFVGETKKATVFAASTLEAIAEFRERFGHHQKGVWAMQVAHIVSEVAK